MDISMFQFWLGMGVVLVFAETLLPGLVSIFVGFGAITVAILMHYQFIDTVPEQLVTWFVSSIVYIFSLRLLVMKYYPSDTVKESINEDDLVIGTQVEVVEAIVKDGTGRISYGGSTWAAESQNSQDIAAGKKAKVIKRDNITWLVEELKNKEEK